MAISGAAIVAEIIATSVLKAADGFTRLIPLLMVIAGYATAFYFYPLLCERCPLVSPCIFKR